LESVLIEKIAIRMFLFMLTALSVAMYFMCRKKPEARYQPVRISKRVTRFEKEIELEKENTKENHSMALYVRICLIALGQLAVILALLAGIRWGFLVSGFMLNTWGMFRLVMKNTASPTWVLLATGGICLACSIAIFCGVPDSKALVAFAVGFLIEMIVAVQLLPEKDRPEKKDRQEKLDSKKGPD